MRSLDVRYPEHPLVPEGERGFLAALVLVVFLFGVVCGTLIPSAPSRCLDLPRVEGGGHA